MIGENHFSHCFISWSHIHGGSNAAHYEYCSELARAGDRVTLIVRGKGAAYWEHENLLIYPVDFNGWPDALAHVAFKLVVVRHLSRCRYDFVDVFLAPGVSLYRFFLFWKRLKWVLHIRTSFVAGGWRGWLKNRLGHWESRWFDAVTIIDRGIASNLHFSDSVAEGFLELPLGVNPRSFVVRPDQRRQLLGDSAAGRRILIYVGRLDRSRRPEVMLHAFDRVRREAPDALLVMVGAGDLPGLKVVAESLGIGEHVVFVGSVSYNSVADYVASGDVALTYIPMTPTYDSQPALKALEYLQMGIPQVATATQANRKVLRDGENAVLTGDDEAGFAEGILRLLGDAGLYDRIRRNSRVDIGRHYWETIVKETLQPFYSRIRENAVNG
ncbi:MAG: glycosyltransferase family 4 protein [Gammaproteobacteria bacterium]